MEAMPAGSFNVSVENIDYRPISLDEVLEKIRK
jgi:calcineurin-like phosphoesterase family protein